MFADTLFGGILRCVERNAGRVNASRRRRASRGRRGRPGGRRRFRASSASPQSRVRAGAAIHVLVSVEEHPDVPVTRLQRDLQGRAAVHVDDGRVAVRMREQQPHDVGVPVLRRAHQSGAAVLVLDVDRRSGVQKQLRHVFASVRHRQHQSGLPVLLSIN